MWCSPAFHCCSALLVPAERLLFLPFPLFVLHHCPLSPYPRCLVRGFFTLCVQRQLFVCCSPFSTTQKHKIAVQPRLLVLATNTPQPCPFDACDWPELLDSQNSNREHKVTGHSRPVPSQSNFPCRTTPSSLSLALATRSQLDHLFHQKSVLCVSNNARSSPLLSGSSIEIWPISRTHIYCTLSSP